MFLLNTIKLELVPFFFLKAKECKSRIPNKVCILGIFSSFAKLQDIRDGDKNVYLGVFEQLATTFGKQSMVNTFNKPKFY
jgi:hypothetical protein